MAKFYIFINDSGNIRITFSGIGEKYQNMTDGAVISDPAVMISEITRISNECNHDHNTAEFFTVSSNDPDHEWMFYDAGENGWARFFYEETAGEWKQLGGPEFWYSLKDLLWDISVIGDYDYYHC